MILDSTRQPAWGRNIPSAIGLVALSAGVGIAIALSPTAALLPVAAAAVVLLLIDNRLRVPVVVIGGLVVLSTSADLGVSKIAYLVAVALAAFAATIRLQSLNQPANVQIIASSVIFGFVVAASSLLAIYQQTPLTDWLRDAAAYLLLGATPLFALDSQPDLDKRALTGLLILSGLLAGASFSIVFFATRHVEALPIAQLLAPSPELALALFCYACARAILSTRRRLAWAAIATVVLTMLILNGSRTYLALLVTPIAVVFLDRRDFLQKVKSGIGYSALGSALLLVGVSFGAYALSLDTSALAARFASSAGIFTNSIDYSLVDRQDAWRVALNEFLSDPLFGVGPGHPFVWHQTTGTIVRYNIDTPMTFPAKFGLIGIAALALLFAQIIRLAWRAAEDREGVLLRAALISFLATTAMVGVLGDPLEDKGFSLGLVLLLSLIVRNSTESSSPRTIVSLSEMRSTAIGPDLRAPARSRLRGSIRESGPRTRSVS